MLIEAIKILGILGTVEIYRQAYYYYFLIINFLKGNC